MNPDKQTRIENYKIFSQKLKNFDVCPSIKTLLVDLLRVDMKDRQGSLQYVKKSEFFRGFDWRHYKNDPINFTYA